MFLILVRRRCDRLIKHDALIVHGGEVLHQSFREILARHSKHMLYKENHERHRKSRGESVVRTKRKNVHLNLLPNIIINQHPFPNLIRFPSFPNAQIKDTTYDYCYVKFEYAFTFFTGSYA